MLKRLLLLVLFVTPISHAEIFKIEIGKDYSNYSDHDLRRRVWELERAVFQLQQKVFQLEMGGNSRLETTASWICKTEAMGEKFSAVGGSKAVAENAVMEKCKSSPKSSDGFHCSTPKCEQ